MWMLNNQTPFAAERTWVRDKNGAEVWLVAVKGSFDIRPDGILIPAEEQEPVVIAPEFRDNPQSSSLLSDTDLPHKKAATDVLLFGHAYAPGGNPVKRLRVVMRVGNIYKELHVTGDRWWLDSASGVVVSDVQPFVEMPITYERAFGGMDLTSDDPKKHDWELCNPAGCGFATHGEHLIGKPVPNIEDPKKLLSNWRQRPRPAGFGPIAGHWSPRRNFTGTYDEKWEKTRQPLLPDDFDERFYQCAPEDQQVPGYLKGGELVDLYNLTPSGRLQFRLPHVSLSFTTHFDDGTREDHRAVLHSVILRPDIPRVVMVWHTHLECHHKVLKLNQTVIRIKERILLSEQDQANAVAGL
jgi:hypothetical protein